MPRMPSAARAGAWLLRAWLCGAVLQAGAAGAAPPDLPSALRRPALVTPKALQAVMLAVARAGSRLVAVGERGTVLLSDDNGRAWRQAQVPVRATLAGLCFADAQQGWAVGHLGVVLRTSDGGQTWARQLDGVQAAQLALQAARSAPDEAEQRSAQQLLEDGPDKPFFDVVCLDGQRAIAVGAYDMVFATDDGGRRWRPMHKALAQRQGVHLYAIRQVGGRLFIAGEQGLLMRSDDGGASFQRLQTPYKGSYFGLLASPTGAVVAYGLRGNAYRSADQGQTWAQVRTGVTEGISAGVARADRSLALLSQDGQVLASRDDGMTFSRQASVAMPAAGLAEAASDAGLIVAGLRGLRVLPSSP
ncbi:YCF48-related protein [Rhizobacter sp. Root1221]|uniref:WD40/YVTN/BNR-like repeat-containing protein n=1 Tax=Rhizobacter sp. Root1221 TaxID=1736433 RepID=UPI0006F2643E|nr:YCF48-related protein [Rhizobacter sp. Root1221]KQV99338.1 hypothetical protein ASC87_21380 [Rhizobacter sp. Root1221]